MPQLLNHLNQDELSQQALDWGTLVVYSCPASCVAPAGVGYVEEFVWAQPPP
jgi:pre-rRNA-processing protein TSR4